MGAQLISLGGCCLKETMFGAKTAAMASDRRRRRSGWDDSLARWRPKENPHSPPKVQARFIHIFAGGRGPVGHVDTVTTPRPGPAESTEDPRFCQELRAGLPSTRRSFKVQTSTGKSGLEIREGWTKPSAQRCAEEICAIRLDVDRRPPPHGGPANAGFGTTGFAARSPKTAVNPSGRGVTSTGLGRRQPETSRGLHLARRQRGGLPLGVSFPPPGVHTRARNVNYTAEAPVERRSSSTSQTRHQRPRIRKQAPASTLAPRKDWMRLHSENSHPGGMTLEGPHRVVSRCLPHADRGDRRASTSTRGNRRAHPLRCTARTDPRREGCSVARADSSRARRVGSCKFFQGGLGHAGNISSE